MFSKDSFRDLVVEEIKKNAGNNYTDNWDYPLFGPYQEKSTTRKKVNAVLSTVLPRSVYARQLVNYTIGKHLDGLCYLYNHLADDASKNLLVNIISYRILGHKKVKLPLSTPEYWESLKKTEQLMVDQTDVIDPAFLDFKLKKHDLRPLGYPITFYFTPTGVMVDFIIKEYVYHEGNVLIKPDKGDVVIDAGACWGDTALFFSNEVGPNGKVYSFEFVPSNIDILRKNLGLNSELAQRINLVQHPLWNKSGQDVYFNNNGPGTRVSMEKFDNYTGSTTTLTIDDFVKRENPGKVDFIKMDIEGAEPYTVAGAKQTLINYKPKLAIAVYHNLSDFYTIPEFVQSLNLGYKFYLKHATIHAEETVLFATV